LDQLELIDWEGQNEYLKSIEENYKESIKYVMDKEKNLFFQ
jgi:hypothetical protein